MSHLVDNARQLAWCLVDGEWNQEALIERLTVVLDGGPPNPGQLAARLLLCGGDARSPRFEQIVHILVTDTVFRKHFSSVRRIRLQPARARMQPQPEHLVTLVLPRLPTGLDLAQWLGISRDELDWYAGLNRRYSSSIDARLDHYRYEWRDRSNGFPRLLEKPKPCLKSLQKDIQQKILDRVPVHDSAHGFRRNRSCRTGAEPHSGRNVLLRMDLQDFFASVTRGRVAGIFRMIGYPQSVAHYLAALCTHRTPLAGCGDEAKSLPFSLRQRLMEWHLPQGAPTSPVLSNLCTWRLDARLTGLAGRLGLTYTRYADDLAFSGPSLLYRRRRFIEPLIGSIALEEGFRINCRKTRWMRSSQQQRFCGIVVNQRPNLSRKDFDRLKATLHNCIRFGPDSQNRDRHPDFLRHLEGRVSYLMYLDPKRGKKLRGMLASINWN
ncbi:MAG: RNA-directed DNA polymerase [Gammaproteobacteria bacterium]|nr:RNA-directed DNA polymerase [Gammaproteobacteria bacterium]